MFPMDDVNDAEDETTDVESWKPGKQHPSNNQLFDYMIFVCKLFWMLNKSYKEKELDK